MHCVGKKVLAEEIASLSRLYERFDEASFAEIVSVILNHPGKVVFAGIGKSGYIAQKLASTFNSTGTRAVFLHPAEAMHGDFGIYSEGDPSILLSRSGSTEEVLRLIPILKQFNSPIIALVGNLTSPLARQADFVLDASIVREADPLGFVPTSSTTVALALGDALACALMEARGFQKSDFFKFHPGGQLGKNLRKTVGELTCPLSQVACVSREASLRCVVIEMTEKPLGAAFVLDDGKRLLGLITDGDIRRCLQSCQNIEQIFAKDIMQTHPITVVTSLHLGDAVRLMEDRPRQLSVLPVFDENRNCVGLFRLHDAYRRELK
jgi:arabinose-5-phosphate isomerase